MTIRNLDALFKPSAIALIGASRRPGSVGAVVARNLFAAGFDGPVLPVNPRAGSIESAIAYASVADLPLTPDLAVVCTPPDTVPQLVDELGRRGTRGIVVITAGFGELGAGGAELQRAMLRAAAPHLVRIVGPNCVGIMVPSRRVNASFVHVQPLPGDIALVSQSGAVVTSVVDWASARGIGFSHIVSVGDMADVDFGDLLDYLAGAAETKSILLYVEAVTNARKFMSAARSAARAKPVIVIKSGRTAEAARAAASHTGALAGADAVYDAAFRRAGMLRVDDLEELFDAVATLASGIAVQGDRLAILSNGGGMGVLATDSLVEQGGRLAELSPATVAALDAALPPTWSRANPVDIIGDAGPDRYRAALTPLLADPGSDAVLVLNCPTAVADSVENASAVIGLSAGARKPVLTSWLGETAAHQARHLFAGARIPTYDTPGQAVRAFMHLVRYRRNQDLLVQTPPSVPELFRDDPGRIRAVIDEALGRGETWLPPADVRRVLDACGIPIVHEIFVRTPEEAEAEAAKLAGPAALKIVSPDILHKSDVGGVRLNLETPQQVGEAARRMQGGIGQKARIDGFLVQPMIATASATELIIGIKDDPTFGPVVLFGQGGIAVEVLGDVALALPPLNPILARETIERTRAFKLLQGFRNRPAAKLDDIVLTLLRVAQLAVEVPEIAELDLNPLVASDTGVVALDARIKIQRAAGRARLAISPYPRELEAAGRTRTGARFLIRPIRPEDEPLLQAMITQVSSEDMRMRFFASTRRLPPRVSARLTQIDYDREMAFVAMPVQAAPAAEELVGVVRLAADPDGAEAEFAILVRSDLKGIGLGFLLMTRLIDYARSRGIARLRGTILRENATMLRMADELGFQRSESDADPATVEVRLDLSGPQAAPAKATD